MTAAIFEQVFFTAWFIALVYIILMVLLAFRLGWLRRSGKAPDAPTTLGFMLAWLGLGAVWFIFSARHRRLADPFTSQLVVICRCLFVICLSLLAFIIWNVWA